jgi:GH43 family beta-xylosidase
MGAVVLGLVSGLSWGVADFLGGLASRRAAAFAVVALSQAAGLVVALVVAAVLRPDLPPPDKALLGAAAGLTGVIGLMAFYRAMAVGSMSVIAPVTALGAAVPVVVWRRHETGAMGSHIWAAELHRIDGKWYIYFAAGRADSVWNIRIYALENASPDPLRGTWVEKGQIDTGWESFALDATTFVHRGRRYLLWAQKDAAIRGNTNLYIAPMRDATTLGGPAVRLSKPELPWEIVGYWVNEGPAVLIRHGRVFLTYSASATDANYCMGMLVASDTSDLLDPHSWTKSAQPVFRSSAATGQWGPGHDSFTVDASGADVIVYHARTYRDIAGDPLHDPNRHTRAQYVRWHADGTPDFGEPVHDGVVAPVPTTAGQ